jgi:hypothetical protein
LSLFGPKKPSPHCGKKVHRPRPGRGGGYLCPHCGWPGPWATAEEVRAWTAQQEARVRYDALLARLAAGAADSSAVELRQAVAAAGFSPQELEQKALSSFAQFARLVLQDDIVTLEEDRQIGTLVGALGLSWESIRRAYPDIPTHLLIAEANAGLLPQLSESLLIPKKGEIVHLEWPASLMKEVTLREFRGGYQGFSFPIGKTGIRYRVGGARGHSVVTGTQLRVDDTGTLSISSKRAAFIGARKTIEMPYPKLASLGVFTDGIQFHQSNRVNAPLFTVPNGEAVAAIVNAAVHLAATSD